MPMGTFEVSDLSGECCDQHASSFFFTHLYVRFVVHMMYINDVAK